MKPCINVPVSTLPDAPRRTVAGSLKHDHDLITARLVTNDARGPGNVTPVQVRPNKVTLSDPGAHSPATFCWFRRVAHVMRHHMTSEVQDLVRVLGRVCEQEPRRTTKTTKTLM